MAVLMLVITSSFKPLEKEEEVFEDLLGKVGVLAWKRLRFIIRLEKIEVHRRTADGGPS